MPGSVVSSLHWWFHLSQAAVASEHCGSSGDSGINSVLWAASLKVVLDLLSELISLEKQVDWAQWLDTLLKYPQSARGM